MHCLSRNKIKSTHGIVNEGLNNCTPEVGKFQLWSQWVSVSAPDFRLIWLGRGQGSDIEIKVGWQEGVMDELHILHAVRHARI